jgi:SAM-dependent methyltransferase
VLTVDFGRFQVRPGERVLDLGCGGGRHAFEALRRGAIVVALDRSAGELREVALMFRAMTSAGEIPENARGDVVRGDLLDLPFPARTFDKVIASEVLEHICDDEAAMREIARVLKDTGELAVTVPRYFPERVCWALSDAYHDIPGGHVRIYSEKELRAKLHRAGFDQAGRHHAHALHSPYWWLNCAFGEKSRVARTYHRMLVWDIVSRPRLTRGAERWLNPVLGKSVVVYARPSANSRDAAHAPG